MVKYLVSLRVFAVRVLFLLMLCLTGFQALAQVGVNTAKPNQNAVMELKGTKGFLAPQVKLVQAVSPAPIAASGNIKYGMWVYNTSTDTTTASGLKGKGYYYWDSTGVNTGKWVLVYNSNTFPVSWQITGNTGTDSSKNFVGTTDDKPLVFKIDNTFSGIIHKKNTAFGYTALKSITTGTNNTAFGQNALAALTTGNNNTAIGFNSMPLTTTGGENSVLGAQTMTLNTSGTGNSGIGYLVLNRNTTGSYNTAVGVSALVWNTTGNYNIALGNNAMASSKTGNYNIGIGAKALDTVSGEHNIGIGYNSGSKITGGRNNIVIGTKGSAGLETSSPTASYEMNIGNTLFGTSIDTTLGLGRIGINTNTPRTTVEINGSLSVKVTTVNSAAYTVADDDYIIRVNGTGVQTITLPSAAAFPGRKLICRYTGAAWVLGNMNVVTNGTDKLVISTSGISAGTLSVNGNPTLQLFSDGVNWFWTN